MYKRGLLAYNLFVIKKCRFFYFFILKYPLFCFNRLLRYVQILIHFYIFKVHVLMHQDAHSKGFHCYKPVILPPDSIIKIILNGRRVMVYEGDPYELLRGRSAIVKEADTLHTVTKLFASSKLKLAIVSF